jgi:phage shock protein C
VKRLTKSRTDKVFFGVCGGLGRYFDVDPVIIRVVFVILLFLGLAGLLAYIVLAVIMPEDEGVEAGDASSESTGMSPTRRREALAAVLIVGGLVILLVNLGVFGWFRWNLFWPLVLIAIGAAIILQRYRSTS